MLTHWRCLQDRAIPAYHHTGIILASKSWNQWANFVKKKIEILLQTDYEHTMAKSLTLCGPNSNKYLEFGYKGLVFFVEIMVDYLMANMDKGLNVPKWVLINWPKIPQMPQNLSAQIWHMYCVNLDFVISLKNIAVIKTSLLDKFLALPLKSGCLFSLTFLF